MSDELVITKDNFNQYFRPVQSSKPEQGDCIASFSAVAELVDAFEKRQMIRLLKQPKTAHAVVAMMRKCAHAKDPGTFRVPREMALDLMSGMTDDEVAEKPYEYVLELFYYTKPQYVPKDDPKWKVISIVNLNDYFGKLGNHKFGDSLNVEQSDSSGGVANP